MSGRLPWRRAAGQHSFLADLRAVLAERNFRRLFATRLISQAGDGMFTAGLGAYVFFNATSFPDPGAAAAAFAVLYLPYSLVGPFAGRVHRPLVAAADPGLVGTAAGHLRGPDRLPGGLGQPRAAAVRRRAGGAGRQPVLPVLAVGRAPARGDGGHAGDGQLGRADRRHHRLVPRRPGRARGSLRHRRRAGRVGGHPARRRRVLPDRRRDRRHHAPRPARAAPAGRGRAAARAAGRTRDRGQGAGQRRAACLAAAAGGGRARGDRQPAGDVRDLAADLDPALPELLLPASSANSSLATSRW